MSEEIVETVSNVAQSATKEIVADNNIPWKVTAILLVLGIILFFIIVILAIKRNKNISANAKFNNTEIGFSITENGKLLMKTDSNKVSDIIPKHIKALNTHPLFITFFNFINRQSGNFLSMKDDMFDRCIRSHADENYITNITRSMYLSEFFIKNYIISFEQILGNVFTALESDSKNNDSLFTNTIKTVENILSDVDSEYFLQTTISNIKFDNSLKFKDSFLYLNDFSTDILNIISENIKNKTSEFYRELIMLKNSTFSIDTNKNLSFIYIINGVDRLLNAFLNYLFTIYFDVKNKIILDIYNFYTAN